MQIYSFHPASKFSPHHSCICFTPLSLSLSKPSPPTMPTSFSISLFLLLFSSVYLPLTSATATHNRRTLHEPFLPQDSNGAPAKPPAPQPPTPKYPFSTSTPDKQPSPFFPSVPSPPSPPSPPAPPTFASYPANISSLLLPQPPKSKSASSKFVAAAAAFVVSAGILIAIGIFIHIRRRRRRSFGDPKSDGSENSNGVFHAGGLPRPRRSPEHSSEFLYLGTMVNSRGGGVDPNAAPSCDGGGCVDLRKLHSPELRPLPPLGQQSLRLNYGNADAVGSSGEDEDEEFYSPRQSSAGHESSIGTESASRTVFTALATDNFDASRSESSSSLYTSSSNSGSPTRSISISPPASPRPKSPETVAIQTAPPPPPPPPLLPPRPVMTQLANLDSSPSLSPASSSSPERGSEKSLDSSPRIRISNVSILNGESPVRITHFVPDQYANENNSRSPSLSSLSSPERALEKGPDSSPRISISNVSIQNGESPARIIHTNKKNSRSPSLSSSSSPERASEKSLDSSPRIGISNVSIQNGKSPARITYANKKNSRSPSLSSLSSLERPSEKTQNSSPVITNASNESPARTSSATMNELANKTNSRSPSLSSLPSPEKTQDSPARTSNVSNPNGPSPPITVQKPMAASVALPPPPPPPPPPPAGHWESPVSSTPSIRQPILKPPVLVTPSRPPPPIPSPILVSPVESPPDSESAEKNEETPKPKLKPLHWDKVRASSDREMVWDQLKSSSFM